MHSIPVGRNVLIRWSGATTVVLHQPFDKETVLNVIVSDQDLENVIVAMKFETDEVRYPFQRGQIQPCSIDLRLDRRFWIPRRPKWHRQIDLRKSAGEINILRLFSERWLKTGEGIAIKPGEMLLGRTFESFTIPNGYAGKLEGRSTFARLGLAIHATGDFINPGWTGRMPLQLINHGKVPIIVTPYLPICQLLVVRTTTESKVPYGNADAGHKYNNDEGGPSRYWQDLQIQKLQETCSHANIPAQAEQQLTRVLKRRDAQTLDRFLAFTSKKLKPEQITSAREILERFAERDTRSSAWANRRLKLYRWLFFLPATTAVGAFLKWPFTNATYVMWILTLLLLVPGLWALLFAKEPPAPFTLDDISDAA